MTKNYEGIKRINNLNDKADVVEIIAAAFTNYYNVRKVLRGIEDKANLPVGKLRFLRAEFTLKDTKQDSETIKKTIAAILAEYQLAGVEIEVTKKRLYTIVLKNILVGERITYYAISINEDTYKVISRNYDPLKSEEFKYGNNKFKTREEAELKLAEILKLLA